MVTWKYALCSEEEKMGFYARKRELFARIKGQSDSVTLLDPCPTDEVMVELLEKVDASINLYPESKREREELITLSKLLALATVHGKGSGEAIKFLMERMEARLHPSVQ
jgi:histidinol-phosphate/aromatic aminotransferase/cobyric acid decarboxylase-like protein